MNEAQKSKFFSPDTRRTSVWARFDNIQHAFKAKEIVEKMLADAQEETKAFYAFNNQIATSSQISKIYQKYGFVNENGWEQIYPIIVEENEIMWELPDGLHFPNVRMILESLGALEVSTMNSNQPWKQFSGPFFTSDDFDFIDLDLDSLQEMEEELFSQIVLEQLKKNLH